MRQIALHCFPYPRDHAEIFGLSVALVKAGENADDLRIALRPEARVVGEKVDVRFGLPEISFEHRCFELGRNVAASILKQRDQIIGSVPCQRVLKVD